MTNFQLSRDIYTYVYVFVCVRVFVLCVCVYGWVFVIRCVCVCVCLNLCLYVFVSVFVSVFVCTLPNSCQHHAPNSGHIQNPAITSLTRAPRPVIARSTLIKMLDRCSFQIRNKIFFYKAGAVIGASVKHISCHPATRVARVWGKCAER